MEVEMEFAGRLKKIRIKLIMIGICLIFLGGYSLIQEWKDQKKNTTKKVFDQYTDAFFKENISNINNITLSYIRYNKYEDINIVELNSISQGILNTKPSQNGILIIRDINIPQKRKKITESDIDIFIKNLLNF